MSDNFGMGQHGQKSTWKAGEKPPWRDNFGARVGIGTVGHRVHKSGRLGHKSTW